MKNLSIFILERFFLGLAPLWEARQGISRSISFSLIIIDFEVLSRELLGPTDLTKAQAFCIYDSAKVIMVNNNEDRIFLAF